MTTQTYPHDSSPVVRNVPVLSDADDDIEVSGKLVSGVEGYPPKAAHELAVAPEAWGRDTRCLGGEDGDETGEDEEGETDTGACSRSRAVGNADTETLGDGEADGVDEVGGPAYLVGDVAAAVEGCCGKGLAPDYEAC
jgi:hypothetical protein